MFAARIDELADANIDELDTALAAAKRKRDEADVDIAAITAVVDTRQLFQEHAQSTIKAYLKQQLNCSGPDALRIKRRARLFNQHPDIADVFNNSRIAAGQVDAMATASNTHVPGTSSPTSPHCSLPKPNGSNTTSSLPQSNTSSPKPTKTAHSTTKSFTKTNAPHQSVSTTVPSRCTPPGVTHSVLPR
jgi:hypothetical protein